MVKTSSKFLNLACNRRVSSLLVFLVVFELMPGLLDRLWNPWEAGARMENSSSKSRRRFMVLFLMWIVDLVFDVVMGASIGLSNGRP